MSITENVEAGNTADQCHELAVEESKQFSDVGRIRFWRRMLLNVCSVLPREYHPQHVVEVEVKFMDEEESKSFGGTLMPFGKYAGMRIDDVPLDYFEWMSETPDFNQLLRRYLQSKRIQMEGE